MKRLDARASRGVRCPRCGTRRDWSGNPHRPFCSLACRLIDLGRWLDESYQIAGPALVDHSDSEERLPPRSG
ncbi:MAG TPA: DNA gyrase inhibitor YacG [Candidatus Bathyarchaeia archaeon]|nr:DNA gyrase inhibitor YacG [Candidatus Bathyarchaeia archaeon]